MSKEKSVKLETYYGKYSNIVVYEYRGCKYEVEYARDISYCITPAYIQHRDAQAKIDEALDNPKPERELKPFDADELDEIWEMMGW